eukprot:7744744-Alexandrium_andersonii.AAC.1
MAERYRRYPVAPFNHALADDARLAMWQELFRPPFLEDMPPTPPSTDSEGMALIGQATRTYAAPA